MIRVTAPHPKSGRSTFLDVVFHDGVAEVESLHPVREAALAQHGYAVEHVLIAEDVATDVVDVDFVDLTKLTVAELRTLADNLGVGIPGDVKRRDLIDLLASLPPDPALGGGEQAFEAD